MNISEKEAIAKKINEIAQQLIEAQRGLVHLSTMLNAVTPDELAAAKAAPEQAPTPPVGAVEATPVTAKGDFDEQVALERRVVEAGRGKLEPTLEPAPETAVQQANDALMQEFIGHGSLFAKYLAPSVLTGAKGYLKADGVVLKQFGNDLRHVAAVDLLGWPTGFYRNAETKANQFLLNIDQKTVFCFDTSPDHVLDPVVIIADGAKTQRETIARLDGQAKLYLRNQLAKKLDEVYVQFVAANPT